MTSYRLTLSGVAVAAAFIGATSTAFGVERGPAEIGQDRPALELDALDGTLLNNARMAGRMLIVDFFATWCQPCDRALPDLMAALKASGAEAQLVLVDLGESPDVVRRWTATAGLPSDAIVTLDPNGIAGRRWGARRLPTTFLVDAVGVVRHINRGWGPGYRNRMTRWLRDMAGTSAPQTPTAGAPSTAPPKAGPSPRPPSHPLPAPSSTPPR